ncbi:hypothetical protein CEXT_708911 [Caerostris extrusa]|uniref:Transposase n=1 Tax=Caerostris extrusa TaxID=172846 RepID=A0AAV4VMJ7_CAEEX|nr:hypothetical protein CEXT_708911 [Caerostris extrusa]
MGKRTNRTTCRSFLEKLNFRRDDIRAHGCLSRLNNRKELRNEPIRVESKFLATAKDKALAFCKRYAKISSRLPNSTPSLIMTSLN